jgi:hypothetical protein
MGALVQAAARLHSLDALLLHHGGAAKQVSSYWSTACTGAMKDHCEDCESSHIEETRQLPEAESDVE